LTYETSCAQFYFELALLSKDVHMRKTSVLENKPTKVIQAPNDTRCEKVAELTNEHDKNTASLNHACTARPDWTSFAAEPAACVDFLDLRPDVIPILQPSRR